MNRDNVIARILNEVLQGIEMMTKRYGYLLNDFDYPARSWSDNDVFASFDGSALTDDPVYNDRKELSIYLRGRLDGEYHVTQNILGNLERYTEYELTDEWLEKYQDWQEKFWQGLMLKDLQKLWDELEVNGTDEAIKKIREMKSDSSRELQDHSEVMSSSLHVGDICIMTVDFRYGYQMTAWKDVTVLIEDIHDGWAFVNHGDDGFSCPLKYLEKTGSTSKRPLA